MRLVVARCSVDYAGRLSAHLPLATRVLMVKADGSVLVHSDGGSYKPLNWMSPPCSLVVTDPDEEQRAAGVTELWTVTHAETAELVARERVGLVEPVADGVIAPAGAVHVLHVGTVRRSASSGYGLR